ncbi:helix-turn-helix domain-containing protein [Desulfobacterales bacterium HSG16]|nr:helix-turn-helix domain-containing protein [Desulfobacterales bacterium HSG16]
MKASEYQFSIYEIRQLEKYARQPVGSCSRIKCIAISMIASGVCIDAISLRTGKNKYTIKNWLVQYMAEGLDSLNS